MTDLRSRFPGIDRSVARLDGPAGTLMVDTAIDAMAEHLRSGESANLGGAFDASRRTGALVERARHTVAELLGADPAGVVFGANMTTLTFAFTRAIARTLGPGDQIVCTTLDHDANVTPWVMAAADRGADVVFADVDVATGRLPTEAVTGRLSDRTRWVAVTGASNLLGSMPDVAAITAAAHEAGARVFVDAVHLAPHRRIDVRGSIGCDALVTSPYKWYGPHAGVLALDPALLAELTPYKVRPAADTGPGRLETGTPSFEAIAAVDAAARFLLDEWGSITAGEHAVFATLLECLHANERVTVHGPQDLTDRTPTVLFSVDGVASTDVAAHLAANNIAVWPGHSYAVEAAKAMHLDGTRAGVVAYVDETDVQRLLTTLTTLK